MLWLWLWGTAAWAADGLVWDWKNSVQYELETMVSTPVAEQWFGFKVGEAHVVEYVTHMATTCSGTMDSKRWRVLCSIDSLEMKGQAIPEDTEKLQPIIDAQVAFMLGKTIALTVAEDGRIRKLEFADVDTVDGRAGTVIENLRQMFSRMFAPFDFQMPKDGIDKGKPWRQKGAPIALSLFGSQGTAGGTLMKRRVLGSEDGVLSLSMEGRGTMAYGASMESGTTPMMQVSCRGRSRFNTQLGVLDWAEVIRKSSFSSSSVGLGALSGAPPSSFRSRVVRVGSGMSVAGPGF